MTSTAALTVGTLQPSVAVTTAGTGIALHCALVLAGTPTSTGAVASLV